MKVGLHNAGFLQQSVPDLTQGHCFASWVAHVQFRDLHVSSLRGGRYFVILVVCFNCDYCLLVFATKIKRLRNTAVKSPPSLMEEKSFLKGKRNPLFCPVNHTNRSISASALPAKYHLKKNKTKQNTLTVCFQPTVVLNVPRNSWFCSEFATCVVCMSQLC